MRALLPALLALPLAAALAAGQAADTSPRGQGTGTLFPEQVLHPKPSSLAAGDALGYEWRVVEPPGAALYFSTHIHLGAALVNLREDTVGAKQGRVVADREGLYSVLWENRGNATVTFEYRYETERAGRAAPLPGLAAVALAGAAAAALPGGARRR